MTDATTTVDGSTEVEDSTVSEFPGATTTEAGPLTGEARSTAIRKAYANATKRLREQYRTEFDALVVQEAEDLGVSDYAPKPTEEQKAEQALADLLSAHPHLVDKMADLVAAKK